MGNTMAGGIFFTEQKYKIIRNLAWDILIDSRASSLPVDLNKVRFLYKTTDANPQATYYKEALAISTSILKIFGFRGSEKAEYLTVRILAPIIVLDALNVSSPADISSITMLPFKLAKQRYKRLEEVRKRGTIGIARQERMLLQQFNNWIRVNRKQL